MSDVTRLLHRAKAGDRAALDELLPAVYDELHRIASRQVARERSGHTLQPTALVNEAFIRMFENQPPDANDRRHFIGIASRVMRQVLVDYARTRSARKRAGIQIALKDHHATAPVPPTDVLLIDAALDRLGAEDPASVRLIEMRFFGGMTTEEIAEAQGVSVSTIRHHLRYAQAWLRQSLDDPGGRA